MKWKNEIFAGLIVLIAALALQLRVSAHGNNKPAHRRYKFVVLGPLGGPTSGPGGITDGGVGSGLGGGLGALNNRGAALVAADTPDMDPFNPGANIFHAYKWQGGFITRLKTLPVVPGSGGNNSYPNGVNDWGFSVGWSANGVTDPLVGGPEINAVLWTPDGKVFNLGTMGGFQSEAMLINDRGQISGWFENTTPDPFSFGAGAETQPFLWEDGVMIPLGTLPGGTDALPTALNERRQIVGCSTTSTSPSPTFNFLPFGPFIWEKGKMKSLGSLGGFGGCAAGINNLGQVVGYSDLEGDTQQHAFFWEKGSLTDLSTLGGSNGGANVINDDGLIAGFGFLSGDQALHATIWKNGVIRDLNTVDGDACSVAFDVNSRDQVVGSSGDCDLVSNQHAFLWENGDIIDLNSLIPANSGMQLQFANTINKRGDIEGFGMLDSGDARAFILIPRDDNEDAEAEFNARPVTSASRPATPSARKNLGSQAAVLSHARMARRLVRLGPVRVR